MSKEDNNLLKKHLIDYGLSEKEASIYLALLEVETGTAQEISKKARVNRSSTYVVLESLKRQGLLAVSEDKKIQNYVATNPEIFLTSLDEKIDKNEQTRKNFLGIVPELKALHKQTKHRPRVKVFEGQKGLKLVLEDSVLDNKEKQKRTFSSLGVSQIFSDGFEEYLQKRNSNAVKIKGIHLYSETVEKLIKQHTNKDDKTVLIKTKKYHFPANISIYDDKISYLSKEDGGVAILIENKEIAEAMKSLFDMAWEEAKRLSKENKGSKKRASGDTK